MVSTAKDPADGFDARLVRELAAILDETGLTEIEVERGGTKIRVARAPAAQPGALAAGPTPSSAIHVAASPTPAPATVPAGELIKSPMVGTVYMQAQPGAAPFATAGDRVAAGDTLLLVEAMKTMNPITAPRAGRVLEYLVTDGQPVEFGEPLIVLE